MKIFKFGGASVKDAAGIKNVASILQLFPNEQLVVVVSAMGKTTNNLERLVNAFYFKKEEPAAVLSEIKNFHFDVLSQLFLNKQHAVFEELHNTFVELEWAIDGEPTHDFDCEYDQIVCMGEVISSKILSAYLNEVGVQNKWWDVRDFVKTDNTYREGKVNWELTEKAVQEKLIPFLKNQQKQVVITQGFIGETSENFTTTLGREGSDYTASILAYCANAKDVTIWKDVPGVLNADPKWFDKTQKIDQLSYQDAIELAYYGATVIHPKTMQPIQSKKIPLYVKSFLKPNDSGTVINDTRNPLPVPSFIFKVNQALISISAKDFSFIVEDNLRDIFSLLHENRIKIHLMHNSAISFSICIDHDERKFPIIIDTLKKKYKVLYNTDVELVTIRYYNQSTIDRVCVNKKVFVEQRSRYTAQLVMKNS